MFVDSYNKMEEYQMRKKKVGSGFRVPVMVMIVLLVCLFGTYVSADEEQKDKPLAKVGNVVIMQHDLDEQIAALPPEYHNAYSTEYGKQQLLKRMVQVHMLSMAAREEKIDEKEDVKAIIDNTVNRILAQEFVKYKIASYTPKVSEKEMTEYYDGHKKEFQEPAMTSASHILIKLKAKATPEEDAKALKKAKKIKAELDKGGDFAKLATKYSEDPGSKNTGGALGFFTKDRMVAEFSEAAFSLQKGQISDPVKTEYGYHIIKVDDKQEAEQQSFKDVKSQINKKLMDMKRYKAMGEEVKTLEKKYSVEIY